MKYRPFLPYDELGILRPFLKNKIPHIVLRFVGRILSVLSDFFGIKFGVSLPEQLYNYDPKTWDALALIQKLKHLGIVTHFLNPTHKYNDEPRGYITFIQIKGKHQRMGYSGSGRDLFDESKTLWPAIGEAVERWAWEHFCPNESEITNSSFKKLKGNKINIFSVAGFDDELRSKGHSNYVLKFDEDTIFDWTRGYSLTDKKNIYFPLQWASLKCSKKQKEKKEPLLSPIITTGFAAGLTLEDALFSGLVEVIERDAFMIHWLNKISSDIIDTKTIPDKRIQRALKISERYRLKVYLLYLKTDAPIHTVLSLVIDDTGIGPAVIVGASSGIALSDVINKVLKESLVARGGRRKLMDDNKDNLIFPDKNKIGHKERLLYWCPKEKIKNILFWTSGSIKHYDEFPKYKIFDNKKEQLENLLEFFRENKYQVIYKEILEKKIREKLDGMTVVMVKSPQLQPLYLKESLPAFGGKRIKEVPLKIGVKSVKQLNSEPHPFA